MSDESRFASDPDALVDPPEALPDEWSVASPDPGDRFDVARLTQLLRAHESHGRGWPGARVDDVLVEVSERGLRTRENIVIRDEKGEIRAWGSVHDRAGGRMLFVHIVERNLPEVVGRACSEVLVDWAVAQAREVGAARGLEVQQIDTGAFAEDERQHRWLAAAGFERVRTWWQMARPVAPEEADLVPSPDHWESDLATFRRVSRGEDGMPEESDLRDLHEVLEGAFLDHFNSREETFDEFIHRVREDPGHDWGQWWLAEITGEDGKCQPVGALIGTVSKNASGPDGSYVSYIGVLSAARGRGVAKGLLRTIIADAAARGRDSVGLEVDADSPTGAAGLYTGMGWRTKYVTESWHRDVRVATP